MPELTLSPAVRVYEFGYCWSLFQGGKDLVSMLNSFGSSTPLLFVVFVESVGVCWFYGVSR
jgi:hypothetical protein